MHIPYVELIFDSTNQLDQIGTVKLEQHDNLKIVKKNKRTIIVTSDRGLAALLQREGCLVVKSYNWFAHCVMTLTPDLINYQELTGAMTTTSTPPTMKIRYNFDELVHRIVNIDI
ncbi:unnamed protein product [Rotaria sp. Silwood1]|nr:unnamed protein product [Rotaria sp. Silwood1]